MNTFSICGYDTYQVHRDKSYIYCGSVTLFVRDLTVCFDGLLIMIFQLLHKQSFYGSFEFMTPCQLSITSRTFFQLVNYFKWADNSEKNTAGHQSQ